MGRTYTLCSFTVLLSHSGNIIGGCCFSLYGGEKQKNQGPGDTPFLTIKFINSNKLLGNSAQCFIWAMGKCPKLEKAALCMKFQINNTICQVKISKLVLFVSVLSCEIFLKAGNIVTTILLESNL